MADHSNLKSPLLTDESISRLDQLFEFVPPQELRDYLLEIYHQYIIHEHESLPNYFSEMAQSMQILLDFLKFLEEEQKEKIN